jgi:hypothetical protein
MPAEGHWTRRSRTRTGACGYRFDDSPRAVRIGGVRA